VSDLPAMADPARTSDSHTPSGPKVLFSLDSSVDLAGNSDPERLLVAADRILVMGGKELDQQLRVWPLDAVEQWHVEPAVGSCFLQLRVNGQWHDLLRCPGDASSSLSSFLDRLDAWRQANRDEPVAATPGAGRQDLRLSQWLSGDDGARRPPSRWNASARLWDLVRPFRGSLALLLGLSLVAAGIELAPPLLQRFLVDNVLQVDQTVFRAEQLLLLLLAIVAGLLAVRLSATAVAIWKGWISSRVGTTLTADLRHRLVRKLNELPLAFHDRSQVGVLMSRVAYDTETLHTLIYHITGGLLLQSLQLVGIGVALFYLHPKLALITMLPMPLIIAGGWYFTRYLNPRHNRYWEAVGRQASALTGMLSGIRVVKVFAQEDREVDRFHASSRRLRDARQIVDISSATFTALMGFLFALGGLAVWYIGGRDVLSGSMTLGSLMAFLAYLAMFYTPLTTIAESTTWFSNFFTASRRIFDLLDTPGEADVPDTAGDPGQVRGHVEFQGVSFGYDKNRPVLNDISFTIRPGEMVGIVGRSGSGKSTLVSLIARLYEVDAGRILVDGTDVREMNSHRLRRRIGMVPQEPFLFRGSVAENIAYGHADAAPEEILRAAKFADAHDFIMRMPLAYENHLGEGGSGLSGGERQRLSIARALLFDPAILILDEATASVDAESERAICEAIRRFSRTRTTIAIAHRLSTLQDADRLLVFDQGRLIEQGTHQELLAQEGLYSALISIQWNLRQNRRRMESVIGGAGNGNGDGVAQFGGDGQFFDVFPVDGEDSGNGAVACSGDGGRDERGLLRWLEPSHVAMESDSRGMLRVTVNGSTHNDAYAVRTFPATHEHRFLSLRCRDGSGREIEVGMIDDLQRWPASVRAAVEASLGRRYLLRHIEDIRQVRANGSQLALTVLADGKAARIELEKPGEGFQSFGEHGLLLVDSRGAYYLIPDRRRLPRHEQRLLTLYFGA